MSARSEQAEDILRFLFKTFGRRGFKHRDAWKAWKKAGMLEEMPDITSGQIDSVLHAASNLPGLIPPELHKGDAVLDSERIFTFQTFHWSLERWNPKNVLLRKVRALAMERMAELNVPLTPGERAERSPDPRERLQSQDFDHQGFYGAGQAFRGMEMRGNAAAELGPALPSGDTEAEKRRIRRELDDLKRVKDARQPN